MKYLLLFLLPITLSAQEWQPLFQENLDNFRQLGGTADYDLKDGVLIGTTEHDIPNSFLATKKTYGDFILEFEVLIEVGMNSGVQFRSEWNEERGYVYGYQCEIETSDRRWAGGIYDEARRGWLYPVTRNEAGRAAFRNGTWNHYRIEAIGPQLRTFVNGVPVANLVDDRTVEGFIAFQVHSIGPNDRAGQRVQWRNARILTENLAEQRMVAFVPPEVSYLNNRLTEHEQRTGWRLLWDGSTTKGWENAFPADPEARVWTVKDETLQPGERKADLVTRQQFQNFELIADVKLPDDTSTGIVYRAHPEMRMLNGNFVRLEYHLSTKESDATARVRRLDAIGALYALIPPKNLTEPTRKDLRFKSGQFNRIRIVAENGRIEHWLNDIKVLEYDYRSQLFDVAVRYSDFGAAADYGVFDTGRILLRHGPGVAFRNIRIREW